MLELDFWLIALIAIKLALYLASFSCIGLLLFMKLVPFGSGAVLEWIKRWAFRALVISALATFLQFSFLTGQLSASGIDGFFDIEMANLLLQGPAGSALFLRILALFLLLFVFYSSALQTVLIFSSALCLAFSFIVVGHATHYFLLLAPLLSLHILIVCFWFGALGPLYFALSQKGELDEAVYLLKNFSQKAFYSVILLLIAGLGSAYSLLGSITSLFSTDYGWVLLAKITIVCLLLLLAVANKYRFVPALEKGDKRAVYFLKTSIWMEGVFFVLVFIVTAILTSAVNLPLNH